ncbi:E3 ubiquitin/ISG15 ligase TRIM25-like [Latimeria chalumnae]|uniref:E3 ubiquitin/ISG15 ligase TRIM25-like n=1 Tax=Latimeria chalumnae TaxID=7897 RepID=UPI00313C847E
MAAATPFPAELGEALNCSICLNIYKNPILLSCGHNFCKDCIEDVWESQAAKGIYSCPKCRAEFRERPPLQRNLKLCNVIDRFPSTQVMQKQAAVSCTFCVETPLPAVKTCLQCETSFCESHLKKHNESINHTMIDPTNYLESRKCPEHKELMRYFCTDDGTCVCVTCCVAGKHKTHNAETMIEAAEKRKEELAKFHLKLFHQTKDIEQTLQQLQEHLRFIDAAALAEREKICTFYSEIKELLKTAERKTLDAIDTEVKRVLDKVTNQITELEMKKDNILHKMQTIAGLRDSSDPMEVLEESKHIAVSAEIESESDEKNSGGNEDDADKKLEGLIKENLDEQMISVLKHTTLDGFTELVSDVQVKHGFIVQEDSHLSFDTDTIYRNIMSSDFLKKATKVDDDQEYSENTKRFLNVAQVMCSQSFSSGRHFWEFEVSAEGDWSIGLAYKSIERDGDNSAIGNNFVSWCLNYIKELSVEFNYYITTLKRETEAPEKVGMYLDYEAGLLSFYDLTDTRTRLHTFTCTFTEPVYPKIQCEHVIYSPSQPADITRGDRYKLRMIIDSPSDSTGRESPHICSLQQTTK